MKGIAAVYALFVAAVQAIYADEQMQFYESRQQVQKFPVDADYRYLARVVFVRLKNGAVHLPQLYLFQGRFTEQGVRKIETLGDLSYAIQTKITLPVSKDINSYVLLLRSSYPVKKKVDGSVKEEYKLTDWFFLEIPAKDVALDKPIKIPPFDEIVKKSEENKELLEKLRSMYEKAHAEEEKKMNTPNPPREGPRNVQ